MQDFDIIPAGTYAGLFLGDVKVDGDFEAMTMNASSIEATDLEVTVAKVDYISISATAYSSGTIPANSVVEWDSSGEVKPGQIWSASSTPYAGVLTEAATAGAQAEVAIGGLFRITCSTAITAGDRVSWNGSTLITDSGSFTRSIGTALETHSGSGTTNLLVHLQPLASISP